MEQIFKRIPFISIFIFLMISVILMFSVESYAGLAEDIKSSFKTGATTIYQETGKIPYVGSTLQGGQKAMYDIGKFSYKTNNEAVQAITGHKLGYWVDTINTAPKESTGYSLKGHAIRFLYDVSDGIAIAKFKLGQFGQTLSNLNPFGQPKVYYNNSVVNSAGNQSVNNPAVNKTGSQSLNNSAVNGTGNRGLRRHRQNNL